MPVLLLVLLLLLILPLLVGLLLLRRPLVRMCVLRRVVRRLLSRLATIQPWPYPPPIAALAPTVPRRSGFPTAVRIMRTKLLLLAGPSSRSRAGRRASWVLLGCAATIALTMSRRAMPWGSPPCDPPGSLLLLMTPLDRSSLRPGARGVRAVEREPRAAAGGPIRNARVVLALRRRACCRPGRGELRGGTWQRTGSGVGSRPGWAGRGRGRGCLGPGHGGKVRGMIGQGRGWDWAGAVAVRRAGAGGHRCAARDPGHSVAAVRRAAARHRGCSACGAVLLLLLLLPAVDVLLLCLELRLG